MDQASPQSPSLGPLKTTRGLQLLHIHLHFKNGSRACFHDHDSVDRTHLRSPFPLLSCLVPAQSPHPEDPVPVPSPSSVPQEGPCRSKLEGLLCTMLTWARVTQAQLGGDIRAPLAWLTWHKGLT